MIDISAHEESRWLRLCAEFLPISPPQSRWRYNRAASEGAPTQGWKIHISATILSAVATFESVAPCLVRQGVFFKAPTSLEELSKINSGMHYGYAHVGKFLTVYTVSPDQARLLIRILHKLTKKEAGPTVPFDARYRLSSCIFYRYGSFEKLKVEGHDGMLLPAIRDPKGELVPDERYGYKNRPDWVDPLFTFDDRITLSGRGTSKFANTFKVFKCLAQRGKGGVYKAFDFSQNPPRLCIVKEGRFCGETYWNGTDGRYFVQCESLALRSLAKAGVPVPNVIAAFRSGRNRYLVLELIEGPTLSQLLGSKHKRLSFTKVLKYSRELASLFAKIHGAGWMWQDCKPANIIVAKDDRLRPIDFEGACPIGRTQGRTWNTKAYWNPNYNGILGDLYSLGAVLYFLVSGQLPENYNPDPVECLRRNVPKDLSSLITRLLNPYSELNAKIVYEELNTLTRKLDAEKAYRRFSSNLETLAPDVTYQKSDRPSW